MEVSIIIPVYNAEKYLERCVDSVLETIRKYSYSEGITSSHENCCEVWLIDNNSTDKSCEIATKYAKKYPQCVHSVSFSDWGAAAVRNFGASKARGKYIWFIDADDAVTPDALTKLVNEAEQTEADLVMMGARRIYPDGHTDILTAVDPKTADFKSRFVRYGAGPWQFLIRRKWWKEHGFLFHEGIIHEDMELMSALILDADKFAAVKEPLYLYYQNPDSILHKKEFDPHIFDIFPALEGLYGRFEKAGAVSRYRDELEWFFIWNLLTDSAKDFGAFPEGKPGFSRARKMLKQYFPGWQRNKFLKQKPLKFRIKVAMNYLG